MYKEWVSVCVDSTKTTSNLINFFSNMYISISKLHYKHALIRVFQINWGEFQGTMTNTFVFCLRQFCLIFPPMSYFVKEDFFCGNFFLSVNSSLNFAFITRQLTMFSKIVQCLRSKRSDITVVGGVRSHYLCFNLTYNVNHTNNTYHKYIPLLVRPIIIFSIT